VSFNILYRPTNVFNFAQGELVMLGAMIFASLTSLAGMPWLIAFAATLLAVGCIGLAEERIAVAPILEAVMAVAEDREAALLRGIDPGSLGRWSFFLGAAFAAMTGVLAAPILYASTSLGPDLLLKGFAAAAVGSIGNNRGALIAGYVIGVTEAVGASLLSPGYQEAVIFIVVLAVLLLKPEGLFGSPNARTV
jgi:branched-chain amino acid transport system permease protein